MMIAGIWDKMETFCYCIVSIHSWL